MPAHRASSQWAPSRAASHLGHESRENRYLHASDMAHDEELAERVRARLAARAELKPADVVEKKMFGGLAFMVRGRMAVGIVGDDLMIRVGPEALADALAQPHARPMDFTGRPSRGMVFVSTKGAAGRGLATWVGRAVACVLAEPAREKPARKKPARKKPAGKRPR